MVLRLLCQLMLVLYLFGCSAIGYVKYEEKTEETKREKIIQQEGTENKYIVHEYYLVPDEWWLEYPGWQWSFGFYLWEPYWWYPYYSTRCPGCYLFEPDVIKEPRRFERKGSGPGSPSEAQEGNYNKSFREGINEKIRLHRRFER